MRNTLVIVAIILSAGNVLAYNHGASDRNYQSYICKNKEPKWFGCTVDADCSLLVDECANVEAVNKKSSDMVANCEKHAIDHGPCGAISPANGNAKQYTASCVSGKCIAKYHN